MKYIRKQHEYFLKKNNIAFMIKHHLYVCLNIPIVRIDVCDYATDILMNQRYVVFKYSQGNNESKEVKRFTSKNVATLFALYRSFINIFI